DGRFIVAWVSPELISGNFVNYQLFNTDASFAGAPVAINSDPSQTAYVVPTANGGWAIGWLEGGTVKQQTFASDGTAGSVINVASSAREPTAAPLVGGGWIVVFEKNANQLFYQLYDSSGAPVGSETLAGTGFDPRVTGLSNSGWAITAFINASDANIQVYGFESDGTALTPVAANSGHRGFSPVVARQNNGGWVVAWLAENGLDGTGDSAIAFQRFNADGTPEGSNTLASAIAYDSESFPSIAATGGAGFVLSWTGALSGVQQRVFRFFDSAGLPRIGNGRLTGEISSNFSLGLGASTLRRSNGETVFVYSRAAGVARYVVETVGCIDFSDPFRILGDGEVTVTAEVSDLAGNLATATTTIDAQYDRDVDVVSIAASSTNVPNGSPVTLTVVLERATDFFDLSRLRNFYTGSNNAQLQTDGVVVTTDDGTTWEFAIYPWIPGNLTGSFRPLIFNRKSNIEGPQISLTEDTTAPTLISVVPAADTLEVGQFVEVVFTFSEPVSSNDIITITPTTTIANPNVDLNQASLRFFISSLLSPKFLFVDFSFFTGLSAGETVTYTIDETALGITDRAGLPLAESGEFSFDLTILPDAYVSYAMGLGITEFGRLVNTDGDDLPDWNEWMHNQNATVANDPLFTHLEVITIEGEDYFSITIPSADGLVYEGFSNGGTTESLQTSPDEEFGGPVTFIRNSTDLISFESPLGWFEVIPAVDSGLPVLPSGYGYRTFRFAVPLSQQDRGFIQIEQIPATDFDDL
ncbi:MAG: Ig-like domain-containing protein, partial [Verrucomicrobiota bacterium]